MSEQIEKDTKAENRHLRRLLCAAYEPNAYMDDGEASGQKVDWLRCPLDQIDARILEINMEKLRRMENGSSIS